MRKMIFGTLAAALCATASAQEVQLKDPVGDDKGPGTYTYPTDPVYKPGSFDLTGLTVTQKDDKLTFAVSVNSDIENPWGMPDPANFSVQMAFVFVRTGKGVNTKGLPGLNVEFAKGNGWDKVIILSPQPAGRVRAEVKQKAAALTDAIVVPEETVGSGRTITATVDKKLVGAGEIKAWAYQVVMQSNEGFPAATDLLTRKVNEYEGQHRFGGGNDGECDPHVIDVLAGQAKGDTSEVKLQEQMLAYQCGPDGAPKKLAQLTLVGPQAKKAKKAK